MLNPVGPSCKLRRPDNEPLYGTWVLVRRGEACLKRTTSGAKNGYLNPDIVINICAEPGKIELFYRIDAAIPWTHYSSSVKIHMVNK